MAGQHQAHQAASEALGLPSLDATFSLHSTMQVDRSIARHLYKHALRGLLARRTVVCVTHQLAIVAAFDRVVLMERGCLRKAGPPNSLSPHELREAGLDLRRLVAQRDADSADADAQRAVTAVKTAAAGVAAARAALDAAADDDDDDASPDGGGSGLGGSGGGMGGGSGLAGLGGSGGSGGGGSATSGSSREARAPPHTAAMPVPPTMPPPTRPPPPSLQSMASLPNSLSRSPSSRWSGSAADADGGEEGWHGPEAEEHGSGAGSGAATAAFLAGGAASSYVPAAGAAGATTHQATSDGSDDDEVDDDPDGAHAEAEERQAEADAEAEAEAGAALGVTPRSSTRGPAPQALPLLGTTLQGVEETSEGEGAHLPHLRTWGEARMLLRHYAGAGGGAGGAWCAGALCALLLAAQVLHNGRDAWLAAWTGHDGWFRPEHEADALRVYLYLTLGGVVGTFSLLLLHAHAGHRAARALHRDLLAATLRAPQSYFERTPLGATLNRFGRDTTALDESVPEHGQSGRLGSAMAGLHGLHSLRLKAWGCPRHSWGEAKRLRSHREAAAFPQEAAQVAMFTASSSDHAGARVAARVAHVGAAARGDGRRADVPAALVRLPAAAAALRLRTRLPDAPPPRGNSRRPSAISICQQALSRWPLMATVAVGGSRHDLLPHAHAGTAPPAARSSGSSSPRRTCRCCRCLCPPSPPTRPPLQVPLRPPFGC